MLLYCNSIHIAVLLLLRVRKRSGLINMAILDFHDKINLNARIVCTYTVYFEQESKIKIVRENSKHFYGRF